MFQAKSKAFLTHLFISSLIIGCFLAFILLYWYPAPLFGISGLSRIIAILIAVDLILGPLLTFIVFKPGKPSLKPDLSVIAAIQLTALCYGAYSIYQAHPVYITYAIDRFTPINADEVDPEKAKYAEFNKSRLSGPTLAYLDKPTDPKALSDIIMGVMSGQPDLDARVEYYRPIGEFIQKILARGFSEKQLQSTPENQQKLEAFLKKQSGTPDDYAFIPLNGKSKDVFWVWDRKTARPVGTVDIDPWSLGQVADNKQKIIQAN